MAGYGRIMALFAAAMAVSTSFAIGPTSARSTAKRLNDAEIAAIQQACETASHRYARALDDKDWQDLPDAFAPDGVWEVLGNRMVGHDAIRDYWRKRTADWPEGHGRLHQISNEVIDVVDRDHARGASTVVIYFFDTRAGANKALVPSMIARNVDEYVRTAKGWRLKLRRIERVANLDH